MNRVTIIAEAGVNHNGDLELAKKLVDIAVDAGVDYVKFQTFNANNLVSRTAKKAVYQIENTHNGEESQLDMLRKLELTHSQHKELIEYCQEKKISFFSTAFDLESLDFLHSIGLKIVKIPSGEITNLPYLRKAASLFESVIISTGMASLIEIHDVLKVFLDAGVNMENIVILHCNTEYPTPMKDVNLQAMLTIKKEFNVRVGYSDHTMGIEVPIAAVALGATIIEKHFTISRTLLGPDHIASLEPDELKAMVNAIRNIEMAVSGSGKKEPSESEIKNIVVARKSIVARKEIKKGEIITEDKITTKRPGSGISPMYWDRIIGTIACQDFDIDDIIVISNESWSIN